MARNTIFWNQLLMRSDSITDIDPQAADAREQVIAQLSTISEQFDRTFDPADQFEEYVAVALCQALQRALTPRSTAVCKMSTAAKVTPTAGAPAQQSQAVITAKPAPTKSGGTNAIGKKNKKRK